MLGISTALKEESTSAAVQLVEFGTTIQQHEEEEASAEPAKSNERDHPPLPTLQEKAMPAPPAIKEEKKEAKNDEPKKKAEVPVKESEKKPKLSEESLPASSSPSKGSLQGKKNSSGKKDQLIEVDVGNNKGKSSSIAGKHSKKAGKGEKAEAVEEDEDDGDNSMAGINYKVPKRRVRMQSSAYGDHFVPALTLVFALVSVAACF